MGAGCTTPHDNMVDVKGFGGSFAMHSGSSDYGDDSDVAFADDICASSNSHHNHGDGSPMDHPGNGLSSLQARHLGDGNDSSTPSTDVSPSRGRNPRLRLMMHIQEAGNYDADGNRNPPPPSPTSPDQGRGTSNPRQPNMDGDVDGRVHQRKPIGSGGHDGDDEYSEGGGGVRPMQLSSAQIARIRHDVPLGLVMSGEDSRHARRGNLRKLTGFTSANTSSRREVRYRGDTRRVVNALHSRSRNILLGGTVDHIQLDEGGMVRMEGTVRGQSDGERRGDGMFFGKSTGNPSPYYATANDPPSRASCDAGLNMGSASPLPPSAERAASAPTRRAHSSQGLSTVPNLRGAKQTPSQQTPASRNTGGGDGRRVGHHHHHYNCHHAKLRRMERRWLREAIALYSPSAGLSCVPTHQVTPSGTGGGKPKALSLSNLTTTGVSPSPGSTRAAALFAAHVGSQRRINALLDGEGYNSEVPSEVAKRQWRASRRYHERHYSIDMRAQAAQRRALRRRRLQELRSQHQGTKAVDVEGTAVGTHTYAKAARALYEVCDSSASCSSYDSIDDDVIVGGVAAGEVRVRDDGLPAYRKPLWAADPGVGVLAAQYDLLVRAEKRRNGAIRMMRAAECSRPIAMDVASLHEPTRIGNTIDDVLPHTVPLRHYTIAKAVSAGILSAEDGALGGSVNSPSTGNGRRKISNPSGSPVKRASMVKGGPEAATPTSSSVSWSSDDGIGCSLPLGTVGTEGPLRFAPIGMQASEVPTPPTSDDGSYDTASNSDAQPLALGACGCSSCSCSAEGSSCGYGTGRGGDASDAAASASERRSSDQSRSTSAGGSASCNAAVTTGAIATATALYSCLPKTTKGLVDAYVDERRQQVLGTCVASRQGVAEGATARDRGPQWRVWMRWGVFRKGGSVSKSFLGMLAAVHRAHNTTLKDTARRTSVAPHSLRHGGDQRRGGRQDRKPRNAHTRHSQSGTDEAEEYYTSFVKARYLPLNLSSRVPFLENYQSRFFRIVSAAELHKRIIHPFAVDPPLLMSCAKDMRGEAVASVASPTLVTMEAVEALMEATAAFGATIAQANGGIRGDAINGGFRAPPARSPGGTALISRPAVGNSPSHSAATTSQLNTLNQLMHELRQLHQAAARAQAAVNSYAATADRYSATKQQPSPADYTHLRLQDRMSMYSDLVRTMVHLTQTQQPQWGDGGAQLSPGGAYNTTSVGNGGFSGMMPHPSAAGVGGTAHRSSNPLASHGSTTSASTTFSGSQQGLTINVAAANSGAHFNAALNTTFYPSSLLTEETEKHINGILYRRYGLLLAGSGGTTVDFHQFATHKTPAILRYKVVHTNTSFVKEARTLQETKAAERAKQAEAQQQAQLALQQQQEQQRLIMQQQQLLMASQQQKAAAQPVYMQLNGGGIAVLAVGSDNTLMSPAILPGVMPNSQAVMLMVITAQNQPPQPLLCYIIAVPQGGLGPASTAVLMHPQQVAQFQQQLQVQLQQQIQQLLLAQQQQRALAQPQQSQLVHLQQQQQQLALHMNQQSGPAVAPTGPQPTPPAGAKPTTPSAATPPPAPTGPWVTPSYSQVMSTIKLLPSILYLQSSDVLFGTTRTVRHSVSVPTRVGVITSNGRLADTLDATYARALSGGVERDPSGMLEAGALLQPSLINMPRWIGQYVPTTVGGSASPLEGTARPLPRGVLGEIVAAERGNNGPVSEDAANGMLPVLACDVPAVVGGIPVKALGTPGATESITAQLYATHQLHAHQLSQQCILSSLVAPNANSASGRMPHTIGPNPTAQPTLMHHLVPTARVLEGRIVHPHAYAQSLRLGETALRQWARRVAQYSVLAASQSPTAVDVRHIDASALAEVYSVQQANILAKELSRMSRSNSCEVVTLHPSLLRKRVSGEERRRRKAQLAREPLKRAGAGTGGVPQPLPQQGQPGGAADANKAAKPSSSSSDKPLFSREAISVIVLSTGGSTLASDPLLTAWQQRLAKSLLGTRHSVMGAGASSPVIGLGDGASDGVMSSALVTSPAGGVSGADARTGVPNAVVFSQHLGPSTAPLMVAAARRGALSCRNALEHDAMHPQSANNVSSFMAHCIADLTIHNEYLYKHTKGSSSAATAAGGAGAANAPAGGQPQSSHANAHTNPEMEAQRSIGKALLTGIRLGFMRAAEILKVSVEATNDEAVYAAMRQEASVKQQGSGTVPRTLGGQRFGPAAGRSAASVAASPDATSAAPMYVHKSASRDGKKRLTAKGLAMEARIAVMQQQCRYVADKGIYQYGLVHRFSFTDYPSLMLSLLVREGVLSVTMLNNALVGSGGLPAKVSLPPHGDGAGNASVSPVSTPRAALQHAQATAAALSGPSRPTPTGSVSPTITFTIPPALLDSLVPSVYHHPLTSPNTVADSCALQNALAGDLQTLLGVTLAMPSGVPPPTAAPQFAPLAMMGMPPSLGSPHGAQGQQLPNFPSAGGKAGTSPQFPTAVVSTQPLNDTALARAKFANHALLSKAMASLVGPSCPTSASTLYVRDTKLYCATVGHHMATVMFNISPLAQHVVQNALNIRQQFAKTLATQLQALQHIPQGSVSAQVLAGAEASDTEGVAAVAAKQQGAVVINMQPLQAQLRAFLFKGTSLTALVLGDDIRYRHQAAMATAAATYNAGLSSAINSTNAGGAAQQTGPTGSLTASALNAVNGGGGNAQALSSTQPPVSPTAGAKPGGLVHNLAGAPSGVAPSSLVDINAFKTQQSVVPAGCSGQLFIPLSSLPDFSQSARRNRLRHASRHKRSGSTSSMNSSTGSLASSLHSSASRQSSTHSNRRGVVGETNTLASSQASTHSSTSAASSRGGERSGGLSGATVHVPHRSALRAATDLTTSSRQAAAWLGVQLAANTFTTHQGHDCISPNLKLPLPATTPVGPSVCITTVDIPSVFSQAPVPCAPSAPAFLTCNPPPSSALLVGGALPALRKTPSIVASPVTSDLAPIDANGGQSPHGGSTNSPARGMSAAPMAPQPAWVPMPTAGVNTLIHRLPPLPEVTVGSTSATNPTLPDPLFVNALATVSSVGNLAYTVQTTVHSKSSLSPNYTVLSGSTDLWMAVEPAEVSMFLSMLAPPDWANHAASTNSFLSVIVAAKVDLGPADIRGPFVYDKRRSYMAHHSSHLQHQAGSGSSTAAANAALPPTWVPCSLRPKGVVASQSFLAANGIAVVATRDSVEQVAVPSVPNPPMLPTLPHPSAINPASTHYTSYFLSQTYCDTFGPCDYVRGYVNSSSAGLRSLLEGVRNYGINQWRITAPQVHETAVHQQAHQYAGKPAPPNVSSSASASPTPTPPPTTAKSINPSGNSPHNTNNGVSAPDACTVVFEVMQLLDAFSQLSVAALDRELAEKRSGKWAGVVMPPTGALPLSPVDRLRMHHFLYAAKIMLAYGDYYHAHADGEETSADTTPRTENSWYWEELADLESWLSRLAHGHINPPTGATQPRYHVTVEFPSIPPPPPIHVRLYRRFRAKQADLLFHQIIRPRMEEMERSHNHRLQNPTPAPEDGKEAAAFTPLGPDGKPMPVVGTAANPTTVTPAATSGASAESSTDPMLQTCPPTHGGDDFRNNASVLSEVFAEEAAALDRMLTHYRLLKDTLRSRRESRLRVQARWDSSSTTNGIASHMTACEQPYEGVEFLVRSAATEYGGRAGGARAQGEPAGTSPAMVPSVQQLPITCHGSGSATTVQSSSVNGGPSYQHLQSLTSNFTLGSGSNVGSAAEALVAAHYPQQQAGPNGTTSIAGAPIARHATRTAMSSITYSQPRHYVAQVLAFK